MIRGIKSTNFFDIYEVREHIYAAIKTSDLCMSNAGFVDLGDRVLVFDTFLSIEAAKALKECIIEITGKDEFIIINSHSHLDHFLGNCAFPEQTNIVASESTYRNMIAYRDEIKFGEKHYLEEIKDLKNKLETLENLEEIRNVENSLIIYHNLSHNEGRFIEPNITFSKKLILHGPLEDVELRAIDKAHSKGDTIGITGEGKVAFVGDLIFNGEHPYLGQGDPYLLIEALQSLLDSGIDFFIPGHGPVCTKDKIHDQITYIHSILALVQENLNETETLKRTDLPSEFHHYRGPAFGWNVSFLSEYLKEVKR